MLNAGLLRYSANIRRARVNTQEMFGLHLLTAAIFPRVTCCSIYMSHVGTSWILDLGSWDLGHLGSRILDISGGVSEDIYMIITPQDTV